MAQKYYNLKKQKNNMENFTIHIFGYGETQLISNENNDKYPTDKLTKVTALVDAIWNLKPEEVKGEKKIP